MPFDGPSDWTNSGGSLSKFLVRAILDGWKPIDHRMPTSPVWKSAVMMIFRKAERARADIEYLTAPEAREVNGSGRAFRQRAGKLAKN
jgi:hypothetical protein